MAKMGRCLDKASKLYANPNIFHLPLRLLQRLKQALYLAGIYRLPDLPMLPNLDGKIHIRLLPREHITRRLLFGGFYEYDVEYFLRSYLRPGMVVIDGGANVGVISLISGNRVQPSGQVHSFEPLPATFAILKENVISNRMENIIYVNRLALANRSDRIACLDSVPYHSHLTSIKAKGKDQIKGTAELRFEEVETITLDEYIVKRDIKRVDLLKLDIEGCEFGAVKGARELINRYSPVVICEFNDFTLNRLGSSIKELHAIWEEYGYEFFDYSHRSHRLFKHLSYQKNDLATLVGTREIHRLAKHIGARVVG
jgi:FkbM family methyltransferase